MLFLLRSRRDGREIPIEDGTFALIFHAPPSTGVNLRLTIDGSAAVKVRVIDGSDGLDGLPGFTPRPPGIGIVGSHDSDLLMVGKTYPI